MKRHVYEAGDRFERETPFISEDKDLGELGPDGWERKMIKSWHPGVRYEHVYPDDSRPVWDGMGAEIRTVVAVVKIDDGTIRLLYRRTWRRPNGGEFGKRRVRMTTSSAMTAWRRESNSGIRDELRKWSEHDARQAAE